MNKTILASAFMIILAAVQFEAKAEVYLKHCSDVINKSVTNSNAAATVNAATAFAPQDYAPYNKLSIYKMEVGLYDVSKLKSLKVWIRHHLSDKENLFEKTLDISQVSNGWNSILLDTRLDLSQQSDTLYLGYDYTQAAKSSRIIGGGGPKCSNGIYVGVHGNWKDYSTTNEPLSIRAALVGNEPYDVALLQPYLSPRTQVIKEGETSQPITIGGDLFNFGTETIKYFEVHWKSNEKQGKCAFSCDVKSCQSCPFSFEIEPPYVNVPGCPIEVELVLNDTDADTSNNRDTLYYEVLEEQSMGYPCTAMLVENFVSVNNGFVPQAEHLFDAIMMPLIEEKIGENTLIQLVQHRGYGPNDQWSVTENNPYSPRAIFGPEELQYAPAVSLGHREVMSTSSMKPDTLMQRVIQAYRNHPYQFCQLSGVARADSVISVEIEVSAKTLSWCVNPALVVCLVRNKQSFTDYKDYFKMDHYEEQNLVVSYLTSANGYSLLGKEGARLTATQRAEIIAGREPGRTFENGSLRVSFVSPLPQDFDAENYHIVAYVCEMEPDSQSVDAVIQIRF